MPRHITTERLLSGPLTQVDTPVVAELVGGMDVPCTIAKAPRSYGVRESASLVCGGFIQQMHRDRET